MTIKIGYDFKNNHIIVNDTIEQNPKEFEILNNLKDELNLKEAIINVNTTDYSTLNYKKYDIVRLKYTDRSKWISLFLTSQDKKAYENSPLFAAQKKKTQLFWKSNILNDDLSEYYNIIKNKCNEIDNQ